MNETLKEKIIKAWTEDMGLEVEDWEDHYTIFESLQEAFEHHFVNNINTVHRAKLLINELASITPEDLRGFDCNVGEYFMSIQDYVSGVVVDDIEYIVFHP